MRIHCGARDCAYNRGGACHSTYVQVGHFLSDSESLAFCDTYRGGPDAPLTHALSSVRATDMPVACHASGCAYYVSGHCTALQLEIAPPEEGGTLCPCRTFAPAGE